MKVITTFMFLLSLIACNENNDYRKRELELKEKEIAIKEKELNLKITDSLKVRGSGTSNRADINNSKNSSPDKTLNLPFVGKKYFETRPGISGRGTPQRYIEIKENGDVFFGFEQENQANGSVTKERYSAGQYKTIMMCFFKEWDNQLTYYRISSTQIIEVDKDNNILTGQECCTDLHSENKCPCESKL